MLLTVKKTDPYPISIYIWNSVGYMDRQLYHPYIYFSQVDENMAWARGVASKHWEYIGFNWKYIGFGGSIQEHYGVVVEYRLDLAFDGSENAKHSKHSRITACVNTNCHPNGMVVPIKGKITTEHIDLMMTKRSRNDSHAKCRMFKMHAYVSDFSMPESNFFAQNIHNIFTYIYSWYLQYLVQR